MLLAPLKCPDVNSCREKCDKLMMSPETVWIQPWDKHICISEWTVFPLPRFNTEQEQMDTGGFDVLLGSCYQGTQAYRVNTATPKTLGRSLGMWRKGISTSKFRREERLQLLHPVCEPDRNIPQRRDDQEQSAPLQNTSIKEKIKIDRFLSMHSAIHAVRGNLIYEGIKCCEVGLATADHPEDVAAKMKHERQTVRTTEPSRRELMY